MIRLSVIADRGLAQCVISASYFRITGGAVWTGPSISDVKPLVRYVDGQWHHAGAAWSGLRFEGKCRLVFGMARDPVSVSGELDGLSIYGQTLSANGVPFAEYDTAREAWRGTSINSWWPAFRIESTGLRESLSASGEPGNSCPRTPDRSASAAQRPANLH